MRKRLLPTLLAVTAAAITAITVSAPPASASATWYGATATVYARSSTLTHVYTINPAASPMNGLNSQWVVYQVFARDVTVNGQWVAYNWQGPFVIYRTSPTTTGSSCSDPYTNNICSSITAPAAGPQILPGLSVGGYYGHRYEVVVNYGFWVGTGYAYLLVHAEDCWNTYVTQGITNKAQGATCAT